MIAPPHARLIAPRAPRLVSSFPAFDGVYDDDLVAQDRVFASYQASYYWHHIIRPTCS